MLTQRNTLYLSIDIVDKIIKESYDMETALNLVLYIKLWYRKVKKNAVITAFSKLNSSLLYIASPLEGGVQELWYRWLKTFKSLMSP